MDNNSKVNACYGVLCVSVCVCVRTCAKSLLLFTVVSDISLLGMNR